MQKFSRCGALHRCRLLPLPTSHDGTPIVSIGVVHAKRPMATTSERSALPPLSFSSCGPLFSRTSSSPYRQGSSSFSWTSVGSFLRHGGAGGGPSTTRRWMATPAGESIPSPENTKENRSALLRLLHDPQDAYLASIAELCPSSILEVMQRGPLVEKAHKDDAPTDAKEEANGGGAKEKEEKMVQHALEGLYAMNAVLRMILEDPSSLEEATDAVNVAYEGFVWLYAHYGGRQVSLRAIEDEGDTLTVEEEEVAGEKSTTDGVNVSTRKASDGKGNEKGSEESLPWRISEEKWEGEFKPELKELREMFDKIGERRKIHLN